MAQDKYFGAPVALSDQANQAELIVPSDSASLSEPTRAVYVGTGGNITMWGSDDTAARVWKNVPSGSVLPFRAARIMATGTTAADMLALY